MMSHQKKDDATVLQLTKGRHIVDIKPRSLAPLNQDVSPIVPTHWYNLNADFPEPLPPHLNPETKEPLTAEDLAPIFPPSLIEQELNTTDRYIEIPQTVREIYSNWRPAPLIRAGNLERELGTKAHIYLKYEGVSPTGSHKPNSAVAQAYFNAMDGYHTLTTETGAGQWGASLAMATAILGMQCEVWQVRASYDTKPYRRMQMKTYGSQCHPSPSDLTEAGRTILAKDPDTTGSLGMAISEAVEVAATHEGTNYALGSVLNHVMLHQTIIGQEAMTQLEQAGEDGADVVFACAGGGSNLAGLTFPFIGKNLREGTNTRIVAVEPEACPSLTKGEYRYDYGDIAGLTPLLKMYTLGKDFVPNPIHAGGLRYHGMSPMVSHAVHLGLIEPKSFPQEQTFADGLLIARTVGIVPAPESTHAVAGALDYIRHGNPKDGEVIVIGLSGNGLLDLPAYSVVLDQ